MEAPFDMLNTENGEGLECAEEGSSTQGMLAFFFLDILSWLAK